MLKNPNVRQVNFDADKGFCRITMENGDHLHKKDVFIPLEFSDYICVLKEEDGIRFSDKTIWILDTGDSWDKWKETFANLGIESVSMIRNADRKRSASDE